jgi:carboxyl-terminal processing protease
MSGKDYSYALELDEHVKRIQEEAQEEGYYEDIRNELNQISKRIEESKKNDLNLYKSEIRRILEHDIISRFHLEQGNIQVGFKYDQDLKQATEVLADMSRYKKILNIL